MNETQTLIAYYQALVIAQYRNKPNFQGVLAGLLAGSDGQHGILAGGIYTAVRSGFNLATAVGAQLDILGQFIGPTRYYDGLDLSKNFIGITTYGAPDMGTVFGIPSYESPQTPSWYTMTYEDFVESTLQDGDYRRVLQFLAQVQSCDFAYGTLDEIMYTWFGENVNLIVSGRMAYTYQHLTSDPDDLFTIIEQMGLLPHPAGVSVTVQEVTSF